MPLFLLLSVCRTPWFVFSTTYRPQGSQPSLLNGEIPFIVHTFKCHLLHKAFTVPAQPFFFSLQAKLNHSLLILPLKEC